MIDDLNRLSPVELAAALSLIRPDLLVAACVGLEVAHVRAGAALDDYYALDSEWHKQHPLLPEYGKLQMLRFPPHGDRSAWIRDGPPGHVNFTGQDAQRAAAA